MPTQQLNLGNSKEQLESAKEHWQKINGTARIWEKDASLWLPEGTPEERQAIEERLGWLRSPEEGEKLKESLESFTQEVVAAGFQDVVLLGMGGSSLAPEVLMNVFGKKPGFLSLTVLDSTCPDSVEQVHRGKNLRQTLFLVSSKSGSTIETMSFFHYFFHQLEGQTGNPGSHFVAITDPGSSLEKLAQERKFRKTFLAPPDVGGRYSVLTYFGLVPAALIGCDLGAILASAKKQASASQEVLGESIELGLAMGALAKIGKNKLTFCLSPSFQAIGVWIEQLIAESTGKHGKGVLPVVGEKLLSSRQYQDDRCFVFIYLEEENSHFKEQIEDLTAAGHPIVMISLSDKTDIGQEFFRWEMATAVSGAILGIDPFDQPDVELAKKKARRLMEEYEVSGEIPQETPLFSNSDYEICATKELSSATEEEALWKDLREKIRPHDYFALMAYVDQTSASEVQLEKLRTFWQNQCSLATTLGFGPRFLHSTGQLHKGDSNQGIFLQITQASSKKLPVPSQTYTFDVLINAQFQGDYQALEEKGRRVLRIHLKGDFTATLDKILSQWENAF